MKFFHVYNESAFTGLEKNGLLNRDTGFKIQHAFSIPEHLKFNCLAARGSKLYNIIRDGKIPFYVDRIAGGITYHKYDFDKDLIREYDNLLGDWFLGFQLHESGSNRRKSDWARILEVMEGEKGPYDLETLKSRTIRKSTVMPDGTVLQAFSQDTPEQYSKMRYAETVAEYTDEMIDLFSRRMADTDGHILPCDSYYVVPRLQSKVGMKSFMPEVGCQIPMMREAVSMSRGAAKTCGKTWGTYYECWRESCENGEFFYSMPCFNSDLSNEWYLKQEQHGDDFTSYGENGGSSRLLQNRIYYYALMAGADYFSEEWGLNCSYSDMHDFTLSEYGKLKKDFINTALTVRGIKAEVPFAIVLPKEYVCAEIPDGIYKMSEFDGHRDSYMNCHLDPEEKESIGHIEDVIKLIFYRNREVYGNEGHVITNSRFGDVFDMIYEDAADTVLGKYEYLIDASPDGRFARAKADSGYIIIQSIELSRLETEIDALIKKTMPCWVSDLCWLVSYDETGRRFVSVFNNEGNERSLEKGNTIHHEADKKVKITFKDTADVRIFKEGAGHIKLEKADDRTYFAFIPAAGFVILEF